MTAHIVYEGNLRTVATHLASNSTIITDAPPDNHGRGEAFSPTDLVATALGCCMLTVMGIKAQSLGLDMAGATVSVNKIMANAPRRISRIELMLTMPANNFSEHEKSLLERIAHTCPVGRSLHPELEEALTFVWL